METTKPCSKCKEIKPLSAFTPAKRMTLKVSSWCRVCKGKLDTQYAKDNPEKYKKIKRKSYDANKEIYSERSKQWDKDNPQKALERHRRYNKRFPEKKNIDSQNRRMRVKSAPGRGVTDSDWKKILEFYGNKCLKCGSTKRITLDHVIPITLGGWHDPINIQPLCHSCNSGKQNRNSIDYRPRNEEARQWIRSSFR